MNISTEEKDLGTMTYRKIVQPEDMNFGSALFGGRLLSWIDEAGAMYSMCQMGTKSLVTAEISKVTFKQPAHLGEVVEFYAKNIKVGRTSLTIALTVYTHDFINPRKEVTTCEMVFVNILNGKPAPHKLFAQKSKENERVLSEPVLVDTTNGLPPRTEVTFRSGNNCSDKEVIIPLRKTGENKEQKEEDLIVSDMIPDVYKSVDVVPHSSMFKLNKVESVTVLAGGELPTEHIKLRGAEHVHEKMYGHFVAGHTVNAKNRPKYATAGQTDWNNGTLNHVKIVAVVADEPDKNNDIVSKEALMNLGNYIPEPVDVNHEVPDLTISIERHEKWRPSQLDIETSIIDDLRKVDETTVQIPIKADVKL